MNRFLIVSVCCAAVAAAQSVSGDRDRAYPDPRPFRPPVLAGPEPADNLVVTLPGAPAPAPLLKSGPQASALLGVPPAPAPDDHRPLLRRAPHPILPAEFDRDSGFFCQKLIGAWTARDAYNLFGDPLHQRPAFDDDRTANGQIFAYSDPTGRYREIELDFAKDTGLLRTVFVYPWKLSWQDCRRAWGAKVQSTGANNGRKFYSYIDRHLDVLVDNTGYVISLGLY
jgi:hypothetical protein